MALLPSTSPATLPVGEAKPGDEPKPSPAETGAHTQESMRAFLAYFGIRRLIVERSVSNFKTQNKVIP